MYNEPFPIKAFFKPMTVYDFYAKTILQTHAKAKGRGFKYNTCIMLTYDCVCAKYTCKYL